MALHHAVLALLADRPAHGYELKSSFGQAVGDQWAAVLAGNPTRWPPTWRDPPRGRPESAALWSLLPVLCCSLSARRLTAAF